MTSSALARTPTPCPRGLWCLTTCRFQARSAAQSPASLEALQEARFPSHTPRLPPCPRPRLLRLHSRLLALRHREGKQQHPPLLEVLRRAKRPTPLPPLVVCLRVDHP